MILRGWSTLITLLVGVSALIWAAPKFNEVRSRMRDQDSEIRELTQSLIEMRAAQEQRFDDEAGWRSDVVQDWQGVLKEWEGTLAEAKSTVERSGTDLAEMRLSLSQSMSQVEGLKNSVEENADHLANLNGPNSETLRQRILHPVFQIDAEESVGSAVLVWHGEDSQGPFYLALSAHHVLRDLMHPGEAEGAADAGADSDNPGRPLAANADLAQIDIPCVFDQIGPKPVRVSGRLIAENPAADLALIELRTARDLGPVARLAPRSAAERVDSFTPIWTVGCPLGTTAQATRGEVTRTDWKVGSQPYWMVSSPAYFGNSGGGVFLADSLELVGVFSKIYTHGSYRPQVVTHMGLAVPLPVLHDWLAEIGYGFLTPGRPEKLAEAENR